MNARVRERLKHDNPHRFTALRGLKPQALFGHARDGDLKIFLIRLIQRFHRKSSSHEIMVTGFVVWATALARIWHLVRIL
jgi:hypothetical protein